MKRLLVLVLIPFGVFGQSKDDLVGLWSLDKAYVLKDKTFMVLDVEKHPYDTLHFSENQSFLIKCSQHVTKVHPPKEERWTIAGKWKLRRKSLFLNNRSRSDKPNNLEDVSYRILQEHDVLYINYGGQINSNTIYVRYNRL